MSARLGAGDTLGSPSRAAAHTAREMTGTDESNKRPAVVATLLLDTKAASSEP
jgi:hypothetical protein